MITIVKTGNAESVRRALECMGIPCGIATLPEEVLAAEKIILPGVGAFGELMRQLDETGVAAALKDAIAAGTPYLGICVGLQILFEESEESPGVAGLGILSGRIRRFERGKVPQIGWNTVDVLDDFFLENGYAYFVNSYYADPEDRSCVAATTEYGVVFASAVLDRNIFAVQFHPEKSGDYGLALLRRWARC